MSLLSSTAGSHPQAAPSRRAPSRITRLRRGVLWLLAALALCDARRAAPRPLLSEQRSALSAIGLKACRKSRACMSGHAGAAKAWADSLTYVGSSLAAGEPLRRWPNDGMPITVWIAESGGAPSRAAARRNIARDAFHEWTEAGVPERFVFVPDSSAAMVQVLWRRQLSDRRAGQVTRTADSDGWLRSAVIELSVHNMAGAIQDTATLRAVALHEVGHLLGLEHSPNEGDIMAPWVVARQLSPRDRASAQVLYGIGDEDEQ
jgi:hypothetical protein